MAWTDLTYRQKQLDRAIDGCGVKLDGSDRCLKKVMEAIDALPDEMAFVRERIVLRLRTQQLLSDTDKFIDNTYQSRPRCLRKRRCPMGVPRQEIGD